MEKGRLEVMRVIAGEARRLPLVTPEGKGTRPTTDRIKETLFNIIQDEIPGCNFLDLFSGSGAIGIEALSRGAKEATFVEISRDALICIEKNLEKTKLTNRSVVFPMEVTMGIKKLIREEASFDIVFIDPPYEKKFESKILGILAKSTIIHEDTLIILETAIKNNLDYNELKFIDENVYEVERIKDYKKNRHIFLRRK